MRNHSLATPFMAKSSIISLIVATGLLAGASAMAGDPVYKWKDANGQSHYSQQPPEGIKYQTITTSGDTAVSAPATNGETAAAPAASALGQGPTPAQTSRPQLCDMARKNVDVLTNRPAVSMDINGTGKAQPLTPEQQNAQLVIAKQQVAQVCTK